MGAMPAALRSLTRRDWINIAVAVVVWVLVIIGSDPTVNVNDPFSGQVVTAQDARSYYGLNLADLYAGRTDWNTIGAYPYSPAFAMLVYPLNLLPWTWFVAAWTAILIGAVWVLTGRDLSCWAWSVAAMEIAGGNISLLLALAIVGGFRWPWTWALVLLTKITPGIGLLWFARPPRVAVARDRARGDGRDRRGLVRPDAAQLVRLVRPARGQHRQGRHVGIDPDPAPHPPARSASR